MTSDDFEPRSERRRSWTPWIVGFLVVMLIGGGTAALVCCGGLAYVGVNVMTAEIETKLRDNAVLREHVGEIQELTFNFSKTAAAGDDVFVYDVRGSKASGELTVNHVSDANNEEVIKSATLRLSNGTTVEVVSEVSDHGNVLFVRPGVVRS